MEAAVLYSDLTAIERKEQRGWVAPYQSTLAERFHVSERKIRRLCKELEAAGLLTVEKRGFGLSSRYWLHDPWSVDYSDDLVLPWTATVIELRLCSVDPEAKGQVVPLRVDRAVRQADGTVLPDGTPSSSPKDKSNMKRTTEAEQDHSVTGAPPTAAPERCGHGILLTESRIEISLEGMPQWSPQVGRTKFVITPAQIAHYPDAEAFVGALLADLVVAFERGHRLRYEATRSHVRYRGSPYTSLDVQRGALLTLERYPGLSLWDLLAEASRGTLVASSPDAYGRALGPESTTTSLTGTAACHEGLHEIATPIAADLPGTAGMTPEVSRPLSSREQAQRFEHETGSSLKGNLSALARHISRWRKESLPDETIDLMIDQFAQNRQTFCPTGKTPWQQFVVRRHATYAAAKDLREIPPRTQSQPEPAVTQEGEAEFGVVSDPGEPGVGVLGSLFDGVGAQVGEFPALEAAPDLLDRVEVVGVGRQRLDHEPGAL